MRKTGMLAALLLAACSQTPAGHHSAQSAPAESEPALDVDPATLDAALHCLPFTHPDKPPVLLVHGTFTNGQEQYDWSYIPLLDAQGYDVCAVTYPDRGLGDMQVSAEYVVNAIRSIHAQTGRKLAVIGHSQGVAMLRWAIKWWVSARDAVDDFVMEAGPNHGTVIADPIGVLTGLGLPLPNPTDSEQLPESFHQFPPGSQFTAASNRDDETPGDISYTALYTTYDELVEPSAPVPTAAVDFGLDNPNVTNLLLQDLCPGRLVDHVSIGLTDKLAFLLALDAISHPGPANVERAGGTSLCAAVPFLPSELIGTHDASVLVTILQNDAAQGPPALHLSAGEPPLQPYAQ